MSLRVEGGLEAGEEIVEDAAQLGQLVGGFAEVESLMEVARGDGRGGGRDGSQGPEETARDEPAGSQSDRDEDDQRSGGADEQLVRTDPVPGAGDGGRPGAVGRNGRPDAGQRHGDDGEN